MSSLSTQQAIAGYTDQVTVDGARVALLDQAEIDMQTAFNVLIEAAHEELLQFRTATDTTLRQIGDAGLQEITTLVTQYTSELVAHILTPYWATHGTMSIVNKVVDTTPLPVPGPGPVGDRTFNLNGSVEVGNRVINFTALVGGVHESVSVLGANNSNGIGPTIFGFCNHLFSKYDYPGGIMTPEGKWTLKLFLRNGNWNTENTGLMVAANIPAR